MKLYTAAEYRSTKDWPYAIAAGCVVYRTVEGIVQVLLLRRAAGAFPYLPNGDIDTYHLPKGHVSTGETLEEAALRETAEEAGVEVNLETYLGARTNQYSEFGVDMDKTIHYFAGGWVKDLDDMDIEHSDKEWFTFSRAKSLIGNTNRKREDIILERLEQFLELVSAS